MHTSGLDRLFGLEFWGCGARAADGVAQIAF
jgi:hypothetical protein